MIAKIKTKMRIEIEVGTSDEHWISDASDPKEFLMNCVREKLLELENKVNSNHRYRIHINERNITKKED